MRFISITAAFLATLALSQPGVQAAEYTIDASHSAVIFGVQHLGLGNTYGRFNDFSGTIHWDANKPGDTKVNVVVKVASIDSHSEKRDTHLRNADFFDAGTYPEMTFSGTGLTPVEGKPGHFTMAGQMTVRNVTKSISVPVQLVGQAEHAFKKKPAVGFEARFSIDPKAYGVVKGKYEKALGDKVHLIISMEAIAE